MRLRNLTTGSTIAARVTRADSTWRRMLGFLFRDNVEPDEGMWFPNCSTIHLVGMRVPLDVIFLDEKARVVLTHPHVERHRIVGCRGARTTIELGVGALSRSDVLIGDRLALEDEAP